MNNAPNTQVNNRPEIYWNDVGVDLINFSREDIYHFTSSYAPPTNVINRRGKNTCRDEESPRWVVWGVITIFFFPYHQHHSFLFLHFERFLEKFYFFSILMNIERYSRGASFLSRYEGRRRDGNRET